MSQTDPSPEPESRLSKWRSRLVNLWSPENGSAVIAAIGAVLVIAAFWYSLESRLILLLGIIPLIITGIYLTMLKKGQLAWHEWLVKYGVKISSGVAVWLLYVAIALWLIVRFGWQPLYENRKTIELLDESGVYVTASHPIGIPANGRPANVNFSLSNSQDVTKTITLAINSTANTPISPSLLLVNLLPPLKIAPHSQLSQTISLVNTYPPQGVRTTQQLNLSAALDAQSPVPNTVDINVEGSLGMHIRGFVNSTVDKASPLIIIVAVLFPSLLRIIQQFIEEKEKYLRDERKQEAAQLVKQLRHFIMNKEFDEAKRIIKQLQQPGWEGLEHNSVETSQKLLKLADSPWQHQNVTNILKECRSWPNESAVVFLSVWGTVKDIILGISDREDRKDGKSLQSKENWREHLLRNVEQREEKGKDRLRELSRARFELFSEGLNDNLQHDLLCIHPELAGLRNENESEISVQDEKWFSLSLSLVKRPKVNNLLTQNLPGGRDPFAYKKAEDDLYFLFGDGVFWGGHPSFNKLKSLDISAVIFGTPGSGRTALAHALFYNSPQETLALHITGRPYVDKIRSGFILYLLDFVLTHPSYLFQLTGIQRDSLVYLLVSELGGETLLAKLEAWQADTCLQDPPIPRGIIFQVQLLAKAARKILSKSEMIAKNTMDHEFTSYSATSLIAENQRSLSTLKMLDISTIANALGFERVKLVLDVRDDDIEWFQKEFFPNLLSWQRQGLLTILLMPQRAKEKMPIYGELYQQDISWKPEQLKRMLQYRYRKLVGERASIEQHFEKGMLDYLLDHDRFSPITPGSFIQLWHMITEQMQTGERISQKHIEDALQK